MRKGLCTPEQYQEAVRDVRLLLEGRNKELADALEERMLEASEDMRYELAAKYRDLRKTVIRLSEQQKMATTSESDIDIFGYYREGPATRVAAFHDARRKHRRPPRVFLGRLAGRRLSNRPTFLSEVLAQYYASDYVPREIYVPVDFTIASYWRRRSPNEKDVASKSTIRSVARSAT